jgi:hypothetical protein
MVFIFSESYLLEVRISTVFCGFVMRISVLESWPFQIRSRLLLPVIVRKIPFP